MKEDGGINRCELHAQTSSVLQLLSSTPLKYSVPYFCPPNKVGREIGTGYKATGPQECVAGET